MHYHCPQNIPELQTLLDNSSRVYTILAGGTDVQVEARLKPLAQTDHLLDISRLSELNSIEEQETEIVLGSLVTHQQLATNPIVLKFAPLLAEACKQVGSLQIRNRGTIGGNICNASPCADTVPPLTVLNANVEIMGVSGTRITPIKDFFEKPYYPHISENEVITKIRIEKLTEAHRSAFFKLGRRNALAISRINMAVVLQLSSEGIIREARIAPGSVFPTWKRVAEAESFLAGKQANRDNFETAGKIVADKMIEISGQRWSTAYKEPVVAALVRRTLMLATNVAEEKL